MSPEEATAQCLALHGKELGGEPLKPLLQYKVWYVVSLPPTDSN